MGKEIEIEIENKKERERDYKAAASDLLDTGYKYIYILPPLSKVTSLFPCFNKPPFLIFKTINLFFSFFFPNKKSIRGFQSLINIVVDLSLIKHVNFIVSASSVIFLYWGYFRILLFFVHIIVSQ